MENRINKINAEDTKILCGKPLTQSLIDYVDAKTTRLEISNHKSTIWNNNNTQNYMMKAIPKS